jgi:hypothetical protein
MPVPARICRKAPSPNHAMKRAEQFLRSWVARTKYRIGDSRSVERSTRSWPLIFSIRKSNGSSSCGSIRAVGVPEATRAWRPRSSRQVRRRDRDVGSIHGQSSGRNVVLAPGTAKSARLGCSLWRQAQGTDASDCIYPGIIRGKVGDSERRGEGGRANGEGRRCRFRVFRIRGKR